ncbi:ribonuclease P protein component [Homoserinimonas aerilata]|uniref:Ribonuclease P protein component n=1 Tax=Homoserinimonas aerilata TaxID=1162970 RepID=A0A542YF02_9MICO|nr:ribonuclease P protein component [Homoserinimonas aerilata]
MTVSITARPDSSARRFGFIVSKAVGNAVVRNRVRRRLKAICSEYVTIPDAAVHDDSAATFEDPSSGDSARRSPAGGADIVLRAHPPTATIDWDSLRSDVDGLLSKALGASVTPSVPHSADANVSRETVEGS